MKTILAWLLLVLVAVFVAGCATARDRTVSALNGTKAFADTAHDHLASSYTAVLDECVDKADTKPKALACGDDVDRKYDAAWSAYRAIRATWLVLAAVVQAADLTDGDLDEAEALALLGELADAVVQLKLLMTKGIP